jgi:hypothetical protein
MVEEGFLKDVNREMLLVSEEIQDLIAKMEAYRPPEGAKWIKINQAVGNSHGSG